MKLEWKIDHDLGTLSGKEELTRVLHVTAELPECTITSVRAEVSLQTDRKEKIFMNGFQTWTTSPEYSVNDRIRGIHLIPSAGVDYFSLDRYADYHFVDYPFKRGITHGHSYCYFRRGSFFRLFASLDETPGYTMFRYDANESLLTIERDCSGIDVKGALHAFDLFYAEGSEKDVFDAWFKEMGVTPRTKEKLFGYSSWYNRYQNISEETIREDLAGCAKLLQPGDLFQIDDGWEPFVGDWYADEKKFPSGMKKLADEIHEKGFRAGLWLAPFAAEEKSRLYQEHPDWFYLYDGAPWKNGCNWSGFYSLDIDHPEVREYLRKTFDTVLNEWGFDLVKLDFLYAAAPYGSETESRASRMIRANRFLRELCGDRLILGCGVPVMTCFGMFDYCRISCDVSLDRDDKAYMRIIHRERPSTKNAVTNVITRRELNNRAYISDPDVFFLRKENINLKDSEKELLAKIDALLGGVFLMSDDPGKYNEEQIRKYHELRHLCDAEVLSVNTTHGISVTYLLDGELITEKLA